MSKAELKFRRYLNNMYPNGYIWKVADFKQLCNAGNKGLPDYLVIQSGHYTWYEVKYTTSLRTFNLDEINENQWIEFKKLLDSNVDVMIAIYDGDYIIHFRYFSVLLNLRLQGDRNISLKP